MDTKKMASTSALKQGPGGLKQGQPGSHTLCHGGFGDWAYWLVTRKWFGFGISAISLAIAAGAIGGRNGTSEPRDYSVAFVFIVASMSFFVVGLAALKARRVSRDEKSDHR